MESTDLNLLTRDGAVAVSFTPALEQEHYAELYDVSCACEDAEHLRKAILFAAIKWRREVMFD